MRNNRDISDEDFVRAWQAAGSFHEFIERTKVDSAWARNFAASLRRNGVPLRKFRRRCDITALKALAESLAPTKTKDEDGP